LVRKKPYKIDFDVFFLNNQYQLRDALNKNLLF